MALKNPSWRQINADSNAGSSAMATAGRLFGEAMKSLSGALDPVIDNTNRRLSDLQREKLAKEKSVEKLMAEKRAADRAAAARAAARRAAAARRRSYSRRSGGSRGSGSSSVTVPSKSSTSQKSSKLDLLFQQIQSTGRADNDLTRDGGKNINITPTLSAGVGSVDRLLETNLSNEDIASKVEYAQTINEPKQNIDLSQPVVVDAPIEKNINGISYSSPLEDKVNISAATTGMNPIQMPTSYTEKEQAILPPDATVSDNADINNIENMMADINSVSQEPSENIIDNLQIAPDKYEPIFRDQDTFDSNTKKDVMLEALGVYVPGIGAGAARQVVNNSPDMVQNISSLKSLDAQLDKSRELFKANVGSLSRDDRIKFEKYIGTLDRQKKVAGDKIKQERENIYESLKNDLYDAATSKDVSAIKRKADEIDKMYKALGMQESSKAKNNFIKEIRTVSKEKASQDKEANSNNVKRLVIRANRIVDDVKKVGSLTEKSKQDLTSKKAQIDKALDWVKKGHNVSDTVFDNLLKSQSKIDEALALKEARLSQEQLDKLPKTDRIKYEVSNPYLNNDVKNIIQQGRDFKYNVVRKGETNEGITDGFFDDEEYPKLLSKIGDPFALMAVHHYYQKFGGDDDQDKGIGSLYDQPSTPLNTGNIKNLNKVNSSVIDTFITNDAFRKSFSEDSGIPEYLLDNKKSLMKIFAISSSKNSKKRR